MEPLISVLLVSGGNGTRGESRSAASLRRSRHRNLQFIEVAFPPGAGSKEISEALQSGMARAEGEFVYVAPDNVDVDEGMLDRSVGIFGASEELDLQVVAWAARLADGGGRVVGEILTAAADMADFDSATRAFPALRDPGQLLALFVMRRAFLQTVCEYMDAFSLESPADFSALFFNTFYERKENSCVHKTRLPQLTIHPPSVAAPAMLPGEARAAAPADDLAVKEALLTYADRLERDPYDRVSILGSADLLRQMGDSDTALSMLAHYLDRNSGDAEVRGMAEGMGWKGNAGGEAKHASAPVPRPVTTGWSAVPGNPFAREKVYATYEEARPLVESVSGWLLEGQEKFLFEMAKAVPEGGHILEMGADRGRSTSAMALACMGSDKRIYSIDTFCGNDGIMGKSHDFYQEWLGNLKRLGVEGHCEGLKGFTYDVLPTWSSRPMLDFVFIDASHEYIDVLKDFELIYPFVKDGGWIAFHDVEPGWPGPWRVWLEHAGPLLADHRQVETLTCGRKVPGRPFARGRTRLGFSFASHWIDELSRTYREGGALFQAMRDSLGFASAPAAERGRILQQELIIGRLPEALATTLRCMLGKDAAMDGHLHLWNGILLLAQDKRDEARVEFQEATRVSYPVHPDQASHHLSRSGGDSGGAPARAPRGADPAGEARAESATGGGGGYYGKDYFRWQKSVGAFGGAANLFKFRDHVKTGDTVIDFGSGGGYLLRNLPGAAKLGVEINEVARKEASIERGIDAVESPADLPDACADVIVSNHALEHVESPLEVLRLLRRKLKPGGRAVFVVPHDGPQIAYDPADVNKHLYTWNPMTLGNLFATAGFEVLAAENVQHQWPPDYASVWESRGEEGFHRACREHAARNGNYQVRIVAARGKDPAAPPPSTPRSAEDGWKAAPSPAASAPAVSRGLPMDLDDIPVALVAYKRPEHTARVLAALKDSGARNIHIFCDGARNGADAEAVERTRKLCRAVDWTRPQIHEASENRGLARSIMGAVDGLLESHETVILLEDDCVPQKRFFEFMRKTLTHYRDREEVFGISGYTVNVPEPLLARYPYDLYFLPRIGSWGWATWKRAWSKLERDLRKATREALDRGIDLAQGGSDIPLTLNGILQGTTKDVWTLNWVLTVYLNRGHFIYPTVSHIDNIGMDGTGVHCGVTGRYATRLSDAEPTRFPDAIAVDPGLLANFRTYYDA